MKLILFAIALFFAQLSFAQFRIGPMLGINYAGQTWRSNTYALEGAYKTRLLYHFGATTDIQVTPRFSIQPDLLFSVKGTNFTTDYPNNVQITNRNIGYVHMPICFTLNKEFDHSFIFIGAGPYVSLAAISNSSLYENGENTKNGSLNIGLKTSDDVKPLDAGMKFKAGFIIKPGFTFTTFYELGIKDINPQFVQTYNRNFGASLSYLFSITEEDRYQRYGDYYNF